MRKCTECKGTMNELSGQTPEGVSYQYYRCSSCGEEIVGMKQLHHVAEKYRALKTYYANVTRWGMSLGLRVPKELVEKYHLKPDSKVKMIPEKEGIKIIPA